VKWWRITIVFDIDYYRVATINRSVEKGNRKLWVADQIVRRAGWRLGLVEINSRVEVRVRRKIGNYR